MQSSGDNIARYKRLSDINFWTHQNDKNIERNFYSSN